METYRYFEEALKTLTSKFKTDLINELTSKGHNKTGNLKDSIMFSFKKNGNESFVLELECKDYIRYLEKGVLLKNFLLKKEKEIMELAKKEIKKDMLAYILKK
jgi:hypothetical protein